MAIITTGSHPKLLWPGIKEVYGRQYNEHAKEYTDLFDMETSNKHREELVEVTGFGLAPIKKQGSGTQYDSETQGDVTALINVTYALGYICTWEELQDNLYKIVSKRRSRALAFSINQTIENVGANTYNRGFNSSYVGGDGVELFSTGHVTKNGTQSNLAATSADMSETAIEDMIIQIMGATNSRGLKINLTAKSLHVHRNDHFKANRILKSTLQNDTSNNAVNALKATNSLPGGIKLNHYFTDGDAYFIRTNVPTGTGMVFYWRHKPELTQDNDFDTNNAKAKSIMRFINGWGDWRGAYGNPGA